MDKHQKAKDMVYQIEDVKDVISDHSIRINFGQTSEMNKMDESLGAPTVTSIGIMKTTLSRK